MDSERHGRCPYKRGPQGRRQTEEEEEAEIGVTWPHVEECCSPPEAGKGRERIFPESFQKSNRGHSAAPSLHFVMAATGSWPGGFGWNPGVGSFDGHL